jgi:hypothetical protein
VYAARRASSTSSRPTPSSSEWSTSSRASSTLAFVLSSLSNLRPPKLTFLPCSAAQDMISAVPPKRYGDRFLSVSLGALPFDAALPAQGLPDRTLTFPSAAFFSLSTLVSSATTRLRVLACMSTIQRPRSPQKRQSTPAGSQRSRSNERPCLPSTISPCTRRRRRQQTLLPFTHHTPLHPR